MELPLFPGTGAESFRSERGFPVHASLVMGEGEMLPRVILHMGVSVDGRYDWTVAPDTPYYEIVRLLEADADLSGSRTMLTFLMAVLVAWILGHGFVLVVLLIELASCSTVVTCAANDSRSLLGCVSRSVRGG